MGTGELVAANTRRILAERGETAKDLLGRCGIPASTGSRRLSGRSEWTLDEVAAAAAALGTTPSTLASTIQP